MEGTAERRHRLAQWAAKILDSDLDALAKARKLVALGYDDAEADELVMRSQFAAQQPVYYEQLPNADYAPDSDE
ncbi:MAG TPA: hypothetical protein VLF21_00585 [Candidatus Saccharimonadales bacterium]|nr:hypothetical protein [Candidatus Saccharimonadales bacterium]